MPSVNPPVIITPRDSTYPERLRQIAKPPAQLWVQGELDCLTNPILMAIVGTRRPSTDGAAMTRMIVSALNRYPQIITVSGLAFGIDATVHQTAVQAGRPTIAILAGGVDNPTPQTNQPLARQILQHGGCIVSEYPPGTPPQPFRFLERNRIIAGLAQATLVVEAGLHSGALVTAFQALDENREVLAVPGSPLNPLAYGCNQLLKRGATPVTEPDDVLRVLALDTVPLQLDSAPPIDDAGRVLHHLSEPRTLDQLAELSTMALPRLSSVLTLLELDGRLTVLPDGRLVGNGNIR